MIKSMTAFSRCSMNFGGEEWIIEIKTINHRFFEFSTRLPQGLYSLESPIKDEVQKSLKRGKINLNLSCNNKEENKAEHFQIDEKLLHFYTKEIGKLGKKLSISAGVTVKDLLGLPGVLFVKTNGVLPELIWPKLRGLLDKSMVKVNKAREVEGLKLARDMTQRLSFIKKAVLNIKKETAGKSQEVFAKLKEKLELLIPDKEIDRDRLYREAALLAERSDVTEEIVRLLGHIELFDKKMKDDEPVGRELDFLCQEMNREANTMASKAQIFEVSKLVIQIKSEIEKIREQVQNIE